jgi:streptogramin lyase
MVDLPAGAAAASTTISGRAATISGDRAGGGEDAARRRQTRTPQAAPRRGGLDPDGNVWFEGAGGHLVTYDAEAKQLAEYPSPTAGVSFYECLLDKNGEICAGEMYAGRVVRFNPKANRWTKYVLAEPISHNQRTYIVL